jgi:NADPH:quinone reductase-like Zn-dependent oxidoreductase
MAIPAWKIAPALADGNDQWPSATWLPACKDPRATPLPTAEKSRNCGCVARRRGWDPVFDYAVEGWWHGVEPFDAIFDTAGTLDLRRGMSMLKPKGFFIDINPTPRRIARGLLSRRYKIAFAMWG